VWFLKTQSYLYCLLELIVTLFRILSNNRVGQSLTRPWFHLMDNLHECDICWVVTIIIIDEKCSPSQILVRRMLVVAGVIFGASSCWNCPRVGVGKAAVVSSAGSITNHPLVVTTTFKTSASTVTNQATVGMT
jgi:hypothetical protein